MIDGEQPKADARRIAHACCVVRWLGLYPAPSKPDRCAHCTRADSPGNIVPFGTGPHTWLHPECWRSWHRAR